MNFADMRKTNALKLIIIILIMSAVLVSCTEEEYRASRLYKSLTSYEQKSETVTLKNKKYNKIDLSKKAVLELSKGMIYNVDFSEAVNVRDASTASILNSEIISKTLAMKVTEKDTVMNVISTDIASYGDYVISVTDNAVFTGSGLKVNNLGEGGAAIKISSGASMVLNKSNVKANGAGVESDSLVSISSSEMTVESLRFYEGATVTLDDSRFYTNHGIMLLDNANEKLIHVSLNLKKAKLTADDGALLSMIDTKASVKIEDTTLNQGSSNIMLLKNSEATVTLCNSDAEGGVMTDESSSLNLLIKNGSAFKGYINKGNRTKTVTVQIEENSVWEVTSDSYVRGVILKDANFENIKSNGFTIYYDPKSSTNAWLDKKTVNLPDGGRLAPLR
ncbi:MAG TPA: hypothetical protein P5064_06655 [Clostridia bacterium]|jgi:hypothetical protein|nr:hypothetical protein [Clostridiaceae bacterium]HOM35240.1 hypothetical protein [Clostridia bacterium]HOT70064.1 hypothetical protein [Clostridia bacterium]HQF99345.1 hypothetical protein [Clostridia bacterium]HQH65613.1 hypothetical protein [Clostridia bacterium]